IRMSVVDLQPQRLMVPASAKGRGSKASNKIAVRIGEDVIAALQPAVAGRQGHEILLQRPHWTAGTERREIGRGPWKWSAELTEPWVSIRKLSGLPADIIPYALRHSSIVRGLRAGLPVRLVAALHDTSTVMIERHYAAYITDALDELASKAIIPL